MTTLHTITGSSVVRLRRVGVAPVLVTALAAVGTALVAQGCATGSSTPSVNVGTTSTAQALSGDEIISRAQQWVDAKLQYCQSPNGQSDTIDPQCSPVCMRESNPQWDPYRSDCSGFISWAWALSAPGETTDGFAPASTSVSNVIQGSDLQPGDALNRPGDHIILFVSWQTQGSVANFYEEPGCSSSTPYARAFTSSVSINGSSVSVAAEGNTFTAIRYNGLQGAMDAGAAAAASQQPAASSGGGSGGGSSGGAGTGGAAKSGGASKGSSGAKSSTGGMNDGGMNDGGNDEAGNSNSNSDDGGNSNSSSDDSQSNSNQSSDQSNSSGAGSSDNNSGSDSQGSQDGASSAGQQDSASQDSGAGQDGAQSSGGQQDGQDSGGSQDGQDSQSSQDSQDGGSQDSQDGGSQDSQDSGSQDGQDNVRKAHAAHAPAWKRLRDMFERAIGAR
jgi:uncharacterized membrane protein YgcG